MLKGLSKKCSSNGIGIVLIEYLPTTLITIANYEYLVSEVGVFEGNLAAVQDFCELPLTTKNRSWSQNSKTSEQGKFYEVSVSGILAIDDAAVEAELDRMLSYRYIVRVTNSSGVKRLLGTLENPMRFEHSQVVGGVGTAQDRSLSFKMNTPFKIVFE